jgi:hypothetical protein
VQISQSNESEEPVDFKLQRELASCMSAANLDLKATQTTLQAADKAMTQVRPDSACPGCTPVATSGRAHVGYAAIKVIFASLMPMSAAQTS